MPADQIVPNLIGYVTPFGAKAGGSLEFKISSFGSRELSAKVVQLINCDPNPAGPGLKTRDIEFGLQSSYPGQEQRSHIGSCAIGPLPPLSNYQEATVKLMVMPTHVSEADQAIFCLQNRDGTCGTALVLNNGALFAVGLGANSQRVPIDLGLRRDNWSELVATYEGGNVSISHTDIESQTTFHARFSVDELPEILRRIDHICIAAIWKGYPTSCFNGSIEGPRIAGTNQSRPDSKPVILASWSFEESENCDWIEDCIDPSRRLTLINLPTRAVRSSTWSGRTMHWTGARSEYAAITFHSDDLSDCKWHTTIAAVVPPGTPSGIYGLAIENGVGTDTIPFYVLPSEDLPKKKIVFLAPTFTYMAYANFSRGNFAGKLEERVSEWGAYPHNPDLIGAFGYSTYNRHPDGSGVNLSSRHRPIMSMRPGYLTYPDENGSGLRGFPADSHITDWLAAKGYEFDVITDEVLDEEGLETLAPYDVIITGSHPEYHTRRTIEALIAFRKRGGKLMYLGGNGFYWKIGRNPEQPHLIEVRRAEGGARTWASRPGEYYNQLDGEYGGLWRRNGIPPQKVAGVGFTAEGNFEGTYYVRTSESFEPGLSFLFNGILEEKIGDFGLSGGGAAGFEIDQACKELGTPEFLKVIAASEGHGPSFEPSYEELLLPGIYDGGGRPYGGMRSNIVYGIDENGGGIFSVGSITFCGSLSHNNYDNSVSCLVENCLLSFLSVPPATPPHFGQAPSTPT